jgi:NitT/TauT family transport system ATP-binding protein
MAALLVSPALQARRRREAVQAPGGALTVDSVSVELGGRAVVRDCSFVLEPGVLTAMIGPSGCGKSTLAGLIAGYQEPTDGEIALGGRPVRGPSPERLMMFQETALLPWLTVEQNVMFGPRARGAGRDEAKSVAAATIERVDLTAFAGSYPNELSGGMQRRAELARALVNEPQVLVLDEPFRGLDAMTRALMQQYFAELCEDSPAATLFITTDIDEALLLADRMLLMTSGPTSVREAIDVDLPRPRRQEEVLRDPAAHKLKQRALETLRAEAIGSSQTTTPGAAS